MALSPTVASEAHCCWFWAGAQVVIQSVSSAVELACDGGFEEGFFGFEVVVEGP